MDPKNKNTYIGRSAHLAVMSELAARGYRVTVPEVDVGKDVLAFLETEPDVTGVQVKSTDCDRLKTPGAFRGQIDVPLAQLLLGGDLYYVFAFGLDGDWVEYLIISRESLNQLRVNRGIGTEYTRGKKTHLKLTFSFRETGVTCGQVIFDRYRNAWTELPHPPQAGGQVLAQDSTGQPVHTAAQTVVLSRLLRLGCNAAAVETDKILAFQDETSGFTHIRVKGGSGVAATEPGSYSAEVDLSLPELQHPSGLFYVFPLRFEGRCVDFVIVRRERLNELRVNKDMGVEQVDQITGKSSLKLTFLVGKERLTCSGVDFSNFRNAWASLPPLTAPEEGEAPDQSAG